MTPVIIAAFFVGIFCLGGWIGYTLGKGGRLSKEQISKLIEETDQLHKMYEDVMQENTNLHERLRRNTSTIL